MNYKTSFYFSDENTYNFLIGCSHIFIIFVVISLTINVTLAQSFQETAFQNNQVGMNSFVSGSKGSVYLIFGGDLYQKMNDAADDWKQITNGVLSVAVDPNNDNVLYAINTKYRIIKSLDGGKTWISLDSAPSNTIPIFLYINPKNSDEVFVGTENGLIKTSDAGFNWQFTSLKGRISQFMINSQSPSHYYALVSGIIYISSDKGDTWKKSETGLPIEIVKGKGRTATKELVKCTALIFVNWEKPFLLASTLTKGVFRSDDNGSSWNSSSIGITAGKVVNIAFVGSQRIFLVAQDSIYCSTEGTNWKYLPIKNRSQFHSQSYLLGVIGYPVHDGLLLLFSIAEPSGFTLKLVYLDPKGILIGLNYGVLPHSEVDNVWIGSMNGHPVIYAITTNSFPIDKIQTNSPAIISMSQDDGYSWEIVGDTKCGTKALIRGGVPTDMWLYGKDECFKTTDDGGKNWTNISWVKSHGPISKICLDPMNKNVWYYCDGLNECYLNRYQYDPLTKKGQAVDLKVLATDIVVAEDNNKLLFTSSGKLSTDGGWTWIDKSKALEKMVGDISSGYRRPIYLVSFRNGEIRAVISESKPTLGGNKTSISILKSSDMGSTWQVVYFFPNENLIQTEIDYYRFLGRNQLCVFPNPDNVSNFFIGTVSSSNEKGSYRSTASKVFETKDAGETWSQIYAHDLIQKNGYQDIETICGISQMISGSGRVLFVGGSRGLWKSKDEGITWELIGGVK